MVGMCFVDSLMVMWDFNAGSEGLSKEVLLSRDTTFWFITTHLREESSLINTEFFSRLGNRIQAAQYYRLYAERRYDVIKTCTED